MKTSTFARAHSSVSAASASRPGGPAVTASASTPTPPARPERTNADVLEPKWASAIDRATD